MKLEEILRMSVGQNSTRIKNLYGDIPVYSVADLENDLFQRPSEEAPLDNAGPEFTKEGELLISIIKEKACIVGSGNAGKLFTSAFIRCQYDEKALDPWFFCFFFNESEAVGREIHLRSGMPGLGYYHLNSEIVGQIVIELPPMEKQQTLGKLYRGCLRQQRLYETKKGLLMKEMDLILDGETKKKGN